MEMNVERKKDFYTIYLENGRTVKIDLANNLCYGVRGQLTKKISSLCPHSLAVFFEKQMKWGGSDFMTIEREIVDRIISYPIDFNYKMAVIGNINRGENFSYILENWKIFMELFKNQKLNGGCISEKIRTKIFENKLKEFDLIELIKLRDCINTSLLDEKAYIKGLKEVKKLLMSCMELAEKTKYVNIDFSTDSFLYPFKRELSSFTNNFGFMVNAIKRLELDYKITDYKNDYKYLSMLWEKDKYIIDNKNFKKFQEILPLNFENENYKIFVPKTREELQYYGNFFGNCLNEYEWRNFLEKEIRFVVIITDMENVPKVCCDIDSENLKIKQYLKKFNNEVTEEDLLIFKNQYQNYLNSLKEEEG